MRKIIYSVMALILLFVLTGCSKKIVIQLQNGDKIIETIQVDDSSTIIEKLKQPELQEGFYFDGWYLDDKFTQKLTKETKFKRGKETKIYAKIVEYTYNLNYLNPKTNQFLEPVKDVRHTTLVEKLNDFQSHNPDLTVDGYYIDKECKTKFTNQRTKELYITSKVLYIFNNGYEEVSRQLLDFNANPQKLDPKKLAEDFTYMDEVGIEVVCKDNVTTLDVPATANKEFRVYWQTPKLSFGINDKNKQLAVYDINDEFKDVPVISIPGKAMFKASADPEPKLYNVTTINFGIGVNNFPRLNKIIIGENIESITSFNFRKDYCPNLSEVQLPSTLKIVDDSFNYLSPKVTKIDLPETMEIIISSFWDGEIDDTTKLINRHTPNNNIRITLPKNVSTLANIPSNIIIANGHDNFVVEDNRVYSKDKSVLVADYNIADDKVDLRELTVKQIHALTFAYNIVKTIYLPKTLESVKLNPKDIDYNSYLGDTLLKERKPRTINNDSILWNLREMDCVVVDLFSLPNTLKKEFVVGTDENDALAYKDYTNFKEKILLVGENVNKEACFVTIKINTPGGMSFDITYPVAYNQKFDKAYLINNTVDTMLKYPFSKILEDGKEIKSYVPNVDSFKLGENVIKNYYLTITIEISVLTNEGLVYEITEYEAFVTGITSNDTYVYISDKFNEKPVTKIKQHAFKDNSTMTNLFIPNTVKEIEKEAFLNCSALKKVVIDSTTENNGIEYIREGAFKDSALEEITLPLKKMKSIEPYAFATITTKEFIVPIDELDRTITNTRVTHDDIEYIQEGTFQDLTFTLWAQIYDFKKPVEITGEVGKYYIQRDMSHSRILIYTGNRKITYNGKEILVIDCQLVAMCSRSNTDDFNLKLIILGHHGLHRNVKLPVHSYELLEGSICVDGGEDDDDQLQIQLIAVSKAHKNAVKIVNVNSGVLEVNNITNKYINIALCQNKNLTGEAEAYNDLCLLTIEDLKDETKFAKGWINVEIDPDKLKYSEKPGVLY